MIEKKKEKINLYYTGPAKLLLGPLHSLCAPVFPNTMLSNVDPHGVCLCVCDHSCTAAGSWPKAAVTSSLNPLMPCHTPYTKHKTPQTTQQHRASFWSIKNSPS